MAGRVFLEIVDPWINWAWLSTHIPYVLAAVQEHVTLTLIALAGGLVIAVPLGIAARRWPNLHLRPAALTVFGAFYTVPSIALFALLIPYTGLGTLTAEIPLVGYNVLILVRNVLVGLDGVPPDVIDAADGMGYRPWARLIRIELPLALPSIFAGLRVATVSTIGIVTITAVIGLGGLGQLILRGLIESFHTPLVVATALCIVLALFADLAHCRHTAHCGPLVPARMSLLQATLQWLIDPAHWQGIDGIPTRVGEQVHLSIESVAIGAAIALPVGIVLGHYGRFGNLAINISNVGRAVPSFGILVIAFQVFGLGDLPIVIALTALAVPPMVTNSYVAMREVDPDVKDAARGMGYRELPQLLRVELPLAVPLIMAGVQDVRRPGGRHRHACGADRRRRPGTLYRRWAGPFRQPPYAGRRSARGRPCTGDRADPGRAAGHPRASRHPAAEGPSSRRATTFKTA